MSPAKYFAKCRWNASVSVNCQTEEEFRIASKSEEHLTVYPRGVVIVLSPMGRASSCKRLCRDPVRTFRHQILGGSECLL